MGCSKYKYNCKKMETKLQTQIQIQRNTLTVCLEVAKLEGDGFWDVALRLLGRTELLALRGTLMLNKKYHLHQENEEESPKI